MDLTNIHKDKKNRRKPPTDVSTMIYGKVPPQAKDLEEAVLGACLLQGSTAFDLASALLKPDCFYVDSHQRIFKAMVHLIAKSQPIDILTVVEQLRSAEELDIIGGPYYVTKLTNTVVSSANIESHSRIIYEKHLKREQIRICGEGISDAYEDSTDAFDSLDTLNAKINTLATNEVQSRSVDMATAGVERMRYLYEMNNRNEEVIGVPTGFPPLDKLTKGWRPTYLIILAARPSVGKTAFALNLARNAASNSFKPTPVIFFSLEMDHGNLYDRLLAAESGVSYEAITSVRLSEEQMKSLYTHGIQPMSEYPLEIEYCPALNIIELRAKSRRWMQKIKAIQKPNSESMYEDGMIIIDYLQLMTGTRDDLNSNTREQELSNISRSLKKLAGELNVPIIALSQLSREIEKRSDGRPKLSDLRESGAIEQDADIVAFLQREDYEQADFEVNEEDKDKASIWFKKHRNGKLERLPMRTALEVQRWYSPDQYQQYQRNLEGLSSMFINRKPIDQPDDNSF